MFVAEGKGSEWYFWATHSRIAPIRDAAKTIKRHWTGVLRWYDRKINNGILEGLKQPKQRLGATEPSRISRLSSTCLQESWTTPGSVYPLETRKTS
ncbi:MAG: transposase [Syntrophobacterales bacterium]|nr:transposase [Syntrophobacterales bacterium]